MLSLPTNVVEKDINIRVAQLDANLRAFGYRFIFHHYQRHGHAGLPTVIV